MIRSALFFFLILSLCCFRNADFQTNTELKQGPCAIFVAPTSDQLDSIKAHMKESDFYKMTDDNMLYMSNDRIFLESKKVPISNVDAVGIIKFKKNDGKIVEQKVAGLKWAIILFNGKSDPIVANMVGLENDFTRYMK